MDTLCSYYLLQFYSMLTWQLNSPQLGHICYTETVMRTSWNWNLWKNTAIVKDENKPNRYTGKQAYTIAYIPTYIHIYIHSYIHRQTLTLVYLQIATTPSYPWTLTLPHTYYIKTYTLTCIYIDITYYMCAIQV